MRRNLLAVAEFKPRDRIARERRSSGGRFKLQIKLERIDITGRGDLTVAGSWKPSRLKKTLRVYTTRWNRAVAERRNGGQGQIERRSQEATPNKRQHSIYHAMESRGSVAATRDGIKAPFGSRNKRCGNGGLMYLQIFVWHCFRCSDL